MNQNVKRTLGNWRWWVMLPLILIITPVALLFSGTTWLYEAFHFQISGRILEFLRSVDRSGSIKPITKWTFREHK